VPGIASLLPSATEWVHALGLDDRLAAVTFECDEPASARTEHPVVVTGLDTSGLTPAAIDALVRERVAGGHPLYHLDAAALAAIAPDVVLTQDLCAVCALPAGEVDQALRQVGHPSVVVTLNPHTLAEVLDGALDVAAACGVLERGRAVRDSLQRRLDDVSAAAAGGSRPRVLVLEWTEPPYVAGHWVPDLVTAAGGVPVLARPGGRSVAANWGDVVAAEVDAVLVAPCGYGLADAARQAASVLARLPMTAAVWAIDAGGLVTRPGPRVVDGVEALARALHHGEAVSGQTSRVR
jgi:iron complex transport system substrate-binding protein